MNKKIVFGVLVAAVAISLTLTPAFAGIILRPANLDGAVDDAVLKDHGAGGAKDNPGKSGPNKSPAHWELIAQTEGNFTNYAQVAFSSSTHIGAGLGIGNGTHVWAVTQHTLDDCDGSDCSAFAVHGHRVALISSDECGGILSLALDLDTLEDIGSASVVYDSVANRTTVKLDNLLAQSEQIVPIGDVCDGDDVGDDVGEVVVFELYNGTIGHPDYDSPITTNTVCVDIDLVRSWDVLTSQNGPANKGGKTGGFICPQ